MEIGPYIDYLIEKQGIRNIFGRFWDFFYVFWISPLTFVFLNHAWNTLMEHGCWLLVLVVLLELVVLPVF